VAVTGWLLDKSAAARADDPAIAEQLDELAGSLHLCPVGVLEQLYSARSGEDHARRTRGRQGRLRRQEGVLGSRNGHTS
jgi:predicted nucleic acid-binding protein